VEGVEPPIDFTRLVQLDFKPVDEERYPMIRLAKESMVAGGIAPAVFNAANEVAVEAFLGGRIPFLAIPRIVGQALDRTVHFEPADVSSVLAADREARRGAQLDVDKLK
jgi:1-deoxy-D-xylulose-5-phosphate reductoisomerase